LLFCSISLKHGHHFDYWNQPLNMCTRVCYLDCHEAGLCWYLVIHIENLLYLLQLFYFHLRPIDWLCLLLYKQISYVRVVPSTGNIIYCGTTHHPSSM
jgi:hypothetical protein